jgi:hypothetical protein
MESDKKIENGGFIRRQLKPAQFGAIVSGLTTGLGLQLVNDEVTWLRSALLGVMTTLAILCVIWLMGWWKVEAE